MKPGDLVINSIHSRCLGLDEAPCNINVRNHYGSNAKLLRFDIALILAVHERVTWRTCNPVGPWILLLTPSGLG